MTDRKKTGIAMMIGHGLGVIVGLIVYATTNTPLIVPMAVQFVVAVVTSYLGKLIISPEIPD